MPNYRRPKIAGGTYFVTQVTHQRSPWLCRADARDALRTAIAQVRRKRPFQIEAFVLLPDHFHCVLTLPEGDSDLSTRLRLVKTYVTRHYGAILDLDNTRSASRKKRKERNLWQRRFWDHLIRDERDLAQHCDYIHYNPVRHQLCRTPAEWPFSSVQRFMAQGLYPPNWGETNLERVVEGCLYDL